MQGLNYADCMPDFNLPSEIFAALIGVVIALLFAAVGWIINSKSDHKKWIRERRFEAYTTEAINHRRYNHLRRELLELNKELTELRQEVDEKRKDNHQAEFEAAREECNEVFEVYERTRIRMQELTQEINAQNGLLELVSSERVSSKFNRYVELVNKLSNEDYAQENDDSERLRAWDEAIGEAQRELGFL